MRTQPIVSLVAAWSLLLLLPVAAWAQSSLTGVVRDTSGGVLPGVTVTAASPALIEGSKDAVTDGQGLYRIVDLRPGPYTVTFALAGFSTVKRQGIDLPAEFTATVNAEMAVGSLEETVTVSGEAPIVDTRSSSAQTQFQRDTLEALPGSGRLAILSSVIPGAGLTSSVERSAGGNDRSQTRFSVHGAPEAQPIVDGINQQITGCTIGCFVFSQLNIQEVVVETSGGSADRDFGGMQLTMVPRDGGNTFSGTGTLSYSGPSLEGSNINDALLARHLDPNRIGALKKYREIGGAVGGPIKRNKLWFFQASREGVTQQYADGVKWNKLRQPQSLLYEPDLGRRVFSNDYTRDFTLRLTWQAAEKHKIVAASSFQPNCNCVFGLLTTGTQVTPEAAGPHQYNPNTGVNFSWTHPATNRVLLEGGFSAQLQNQNDIRELKVDHEGIPDPRVTDYRITDQGLNLTYGNVATRSLPRRQYHQRFQMSYITGSHNFKTGVNLDQFIVGRIADLGRDLYMHGTAVNYRFNNGVPNQLTLLDAPWNYQEAAKSIAFYAQDEWTIRKVTVNAGVRYNEARGSTPEQILGAGFNVPERRFAPTSNVPHYRNLNPRLGVAYDLFGTGRTAIKASLGQYPDIIRGATANPARALTRTTNRTWNDANRNYVPDCDLRNSAANGECGAWSDLSFGQLVGTRYAAGALQGFNTQYENWQGSVSVQHELRPGFGLNVGYFRTWYSGNCGGSGIPGAETCLLVTDNLNVTPADYDPYCITVPVDSRLPGGGGNRLCGLYDVNPALFGQVNNLVRPASDFGGKLTRMYNGVDVTINARFAGGGQVSGGLSVGRTVTDDCLVVDSPATVQSDATRPAGYCRVTPPWSASTQVKFLVVYPLPWDIQTSAIYQNSAGIPITAGLVVNNAAIAPSLGRNLAACRGAAVCNATNTVALIAPQTMFEPRLQQVDLRFSRLFRMGGTARLRGNFDVYNIFNASNVLAMNTTYGPAWKDVNQVLFGRSLRVGAQFDF